MDGYYDTKLAGTRLEQCYDLASARVRQHLRCEMDFIVSQLHSSDVVLDLGCGYGRTLPDLAAAAQVVVGVDSARPSIDLASQRLSRFTNVLLAEMDASRLAFADASFDAVVCIQNGISAFGVDRVQLLREALRVLRPSGRAFFSSYSSKFWEHRLAWFQAQADAGLIGAIDWVGTGHGVIVCVDGLKLSSIEPKDFMKLSAGLDVDVTAIEVDESSWIYQLSQRAYSGTGSTMPRETN